MWNSNTTLTGTVEITANQTVTVAPNTLIHVAEGTEIRVNGKLNAPAGLKLIGSMWNGLVIVGTANLNNFEESGASTPFRIGAAGSLAISGGKIYGVGGASFVEGKLIADHLSYDKGVGAGMVSNNGTGSISIDHSKLFGAGRDTGDFFGLFGIKSISLTNSEMTGAHCAFHVMGMQNMKLDHDNIHGNSFGFMMYGSGDVGTKSITNTRIKNNLFGFDEGSAATRNGVIIISHSAITDNQTNLGLYTGRVKILSPLKN
jgi:hypothetical protein